MPLRSHVPGPHDRARPLSPAAYAEPSSRADYELQQLREGWGTLAWTDKLLAAISPTLHGNAEDREWFANVLRVGASPSAAYALNRMWREVDLRNVLPAIRVPTLVLSRGQHGEPDARDVAGRIPNARFARLPGEDYWGLFLSPEIPDELERFVARLDEAPEPETVLATILFTDVVGSTAKAAEVGDDAWADLVERHHGAIRRELVRFRGSEVDTAGDGFFATFEGPARAIRCGRAIHAAVEPLG